VGEDVTAKKVLSKWLVEALREQRGSASIVDVCTYIWQNHEEDLRASGDLFFTWQYDIRWAAFVLRKSGRLKSTAGSPKGLWQLLD
jgi:hypothetical protein